MRFMADLEAKLDAHSYPATNEELIEAYGETVLEFQDGSETFAEALSRLGEDTYEDSESARLAAWQAVSSGAVGRVGYSDRDAPCIGESGPEQVSF
ncbi:DUF2795 domain-containing protein [Halobacteriales archaeon QS_5_70_15]|nr:MAG: DUF2795 domain-containing protein [Halobacteriales archaeon QS_5_70_15]